MGVVRAERAILYVVDLIIVIGLLGRCIIHNEGLCSFILCAGNFLAQSDFLIFTVIVVVIHRDYFGVRISSIIVYVNAPLLV